MNSDGITKFIYGFVAIVDAIIVGLFYGPVVAGVSLRFIPGFDDWLPIVALFFLFASYVMLLFLFSKTLRFLVIKDRLLWVFLVVILMYVIIASIGFAGVFIGGV